MRPLSTWIWHAIFLLGFLTPKLAVAVPALHGTPRMALPDPPPTRTLIIGGDHQYPPYEYLDESGNPSGYNVELTLAIAREMGFDVVFRLGPWADMVQALEDGRIDALQGMFYTPKRNLVFDFSIPHAANHYVTVLRKESGKPPENLEELRKWRCVVEKGDAVHDLLRKQMQPENLVLVETQEDVLREVAEGRHDCGVAVRISTLHLIQKNNWKHLELGRRPLFTLEYCYAVLNGQHELLALFNEGLKVLEKKGELRRLQLKWLGPETLPQPPGMVKRLRESLKYLIPLLVILGMVLLWSWTLRRQVAAKTLELEESTRRFRHVFESSNVGKSLTSPEGILNVNKAFADMLGYTTDELEGKNWKELTPKEEIAPIGGRLQSMIDGKSESERFEKRYFHKDGTVVWADVSTILQRSEDGKPLYFITTIVDITDRKKAEQAHAALEAQLRQSQKMESVGRLAGGVAHDFNNMLGVILGYSDLLLEKMEESDSGREDVLEIRKAAERSADIARQLLAFARRQAIQPRKVDLNLLIGDMLKMLSRLIGEDIRLQWSPVEGLWPVHLDPSQFGQVMANLVINARDAISGNGHIHIGVANCPMAELPERMPDDPVGDYVAVSVTDDGCGIPTELQEAIFEPFYSTKGEHEGSGLGLATVYGIVRQNNGFIRLESSPGQGATFHILLPAFFVDEPGDISMEIQQVPDSQQMTVLLVEDEVSILKLMKRVLERMGHRVLATSDPQVALDLARSSNDPIGLLITDVIMPGMNGLELAEVIRDLYPCVRILFMSGYTADVISRKGILEKEVNFLQKPFSSHQLTDKIHEVLQNLKTP